MNDVEIIYADNQTQTMNKFQRMIECNEIQVAFRNIFNRYAATYLFYLIRYQEQDVGFIFAVKEKFDEALFLDMGILPQYRGKNISTKALEALKDRILTGVLEEDEKCIFSKMLLVGEVSKENIPAHASIEKCGEKIFATHKKDYYLFPKESTNQLSTFLIKPKLLEYLYQTNQSSKDANK